MNLDNEEIELLNKLREIRERKEKYLNDWTDALIEDVNWNARNSVAIILVKKLVGGQVYIESPYRDDLVEVWRNTPGRLFRGGNENLIPLRQWDKTLETLNKMERVEVRYENDEIEKEIEYALTAPNWLVSLEHKYGSRYLIVKPGPNTPSYWAVNKIPGNEYRHLIKSYTIPLSEAWRLWQSLEKEEGVIYTDEAKEFTINQIEQRSKIDKIGMAKDWEYEVSFDNNGVMRPFQRVGCAFAEANGFRTLEAFDMGLGKTWISIALSKKNNFKTLIICPASLKPNWYREVFRLTGKRPLVLRGANPTQMDIVDLLASDGNQYVIANYDIIGRVTEYENRKIDEEGYVHKENVKRFLWADLINMANFDIVHIDEGHYIKNTDSNRSQAVRQLKIPRVIFLTGTPVLNRPGELWPMLTMLAPDTFPNEDTFIRQYTYDGKRAKNTDQLREAIKHLMIRRKREDVIEDMPPMNRIEDYHELSPKAAKIYNRVLEGIFEKLAAMDAKGMSYDLQVTNMLVQIMRLKQVCAIDKCESTADLATRIVESANGGENNKVLIFSQFKPMAYKIAQHLGHEALCFVNRGKHDFVTVDNNERDRLVQQFQNDPSIKYLVVTEKTAKEGHNISKAGYVIFNDLFWTPAAHEQGESRAMRVDNLHKVDSYYRMVDMDGNSIEEWIWNDVLKMKKDIIAQTVDAVEGSRTEGEGASIIIQKLRERMWSKK